MNLGTKCSRSLLWLARLMNLAITTSNASTITVPTRQIALATILHGLAYFIIRFVRRPLQGRLTLLQKPLTATLLILVVHLLCPSKAYSQSGWGPAIAAFNPSGCTQYGLAPDNSLCKTAADTCQMWANLYSSPYSLLMPGPDPANAFCEWGNSPTPYPISFTPPAGFAPDYNAPDGYSPEGSGGVQPLTEIGGGGNPWADPDDDPANNFDNGDTGSAQDNNATTNNVGSTYASEPINVASGNVFYHRTDYVTAGANRLSFTRYYNSRGTYSGTLGINWRSTYDRYIWLLSSSVVLAQRADGQGITFTLTGGVWTPDSDCDYTLMQSGSTWTLTDPNDSVETYVDATGTEYGNGYQALLSSIKARNGYTRTLSHNTNGFLTSVTDSYSRSITFTYNSDDLLASITTPDNTITYGYTDTSAGYNLTSVTYPTSPVARLTYVYGNATLYNTLTGVTDENGNPYLAWTYDNYGRALTTSIGTGSTANVTTVSYNDATGGRTVTGPLGVVDTYTYVTLQNAQKVTQISRAATSKTAAAMRTFTYDSNGYLASKTDWNGNTTTYTNNSHGQPTTIVDAVGSSVARATTITYDTTWVHLPDTITTPGLTTSFTYDGRGDVLIHKLTDTTTTTIPYPTNGQTRTTTNTWSEDGLLTSVKTPNGNNTSFTHDSSGTLTSVTDALNHVTRITAHTGGGLPETIVDPNGATTTKAYDQLQRLVSSSIATSSGALTTSYIYYLNSDVTTTLPDGSFLTSLHDTAHRVIGYADPSNNQRDQTLDANGDPVARTIFNPGGTATFYRTATFDALGHQLTDKSATTGQSWKFTFDNNGNRLTTTDPLGHTATQAFDPLNRVITSTDAAGGVVHTTYDAHDRVSTVIDANGNTTAYIRDGFGEVIQETSRDTGTTVFHFDGDGNCTSKTDAGGVVTNYTFDALDRIRTATYPTDSTLNVTETYDQTGTGFSFGIGRLTGLTDAAGSLTRTYNERGDLLTETRTHGSTVLTTKYQVDKAGRISSITYPSGAVVSYIRDLAGNVVQVPFSAAGSDEQNVGWFAHLPFGPVNSINYANGDLARFGFDQDYRPTTWQYQNYKSIPYLNWTYSFDYADNVSAITDNVTAADSQAIGYDVLNRLMSAKSTGTYGSLAFTYDKNANRLSSSVNGVTSAYSYFAGSNRLATVTASGNTQNYSYTPTGNISSLSVNGKTSWTATYSKANRLVSMAGMPLAISSIVYDWRGLRFSKANPGSPADLYIYDQQGNLIEENNNGTITDYIYVDRVNVANWAYAEKHLYAVDVDHQGVPLMSRDEYGLTNWAAFRDPFGAMTVTVSNGQFTGPLTQNLRLPGQHFDGEMGFDYNGARDYIPGLGRYSEADPIGIAGGLNPYLYAHANAIKFSDASGLDPDALDTSIDLTSPFTDFAQGLDEIFGNSSSYNASNNNPSGRGFVESGVVCFPVCEGTSMTAAGDEYVVMGVGVPGYSQSLVYATSMSGYAEGGSFNISVSTPIPIVNVAGGISTSGATAIGGSAGVSMGILLNANYTVGIPIGTILDNPTVSWAFSLIGLDYR